MTADPQLWSLVEAVCCGTATAEQCRTLSSLLAADDEAALFYATYLRMHGLLIWHCRDEVDGQLPVAGGQQVADLSFSSDPAGSVPGTENLSQTPTPTPYLGFLGSAYHGVTGYLGDHEWAQGVLGGTVFLALLFAVLGSIEIFSRWRQANRPQPQANQVVDVPAVRAARLTDMYDCRWTGTFRPPLHEVLNVNDYINLASGLAEVTYDSGAKVLLQGPCTYRIESPSSGYLQVGRLTAKVGERGEGRGESAKPQAANPKSDIAKSQIPNPSSLSTTHYPLFTINTPTATVTDLGTEFGVDVDGVGATDSLVFVGSVKVNTVVGDGQKQAGELTLIENQSARVERQGGKQFVVRRVEVKPEGFVRPDQIQDWLAMAGEAAVAERIAAEKPKEPEEPKLDFTQLHRWQTFSKELCKRDDLLAYYDFQWDPDDKRDAENHELLRNKAKTAPGIFGRHYDGQLWGAITMGMIEGRFPGKHALKFDCHDDGVRVNIPIECKQMTVAAWVNVNRLERPFAALLATDGWEKGCVDWVITSAGTMAFDVNGVTVRGGPSQMSPPVFASDDLGQWRLVAAVCDPAAGRVAFYRDGECVGEVFTGLDSGTIAIGSAWIGAWDCKSVQRADSNRYFEGRMDELMIFNAALSTEELRRMYEDGKQTPENPK